MSEAWAAIQGAAASGMLIVADHASAFVPPDIRLGIPAALLDTHIAVDIGVASLATALSGALGCPAFLGGVSRLVADLNREEDSIGLVPAESDGYAIPGNHALVREQRAARVDRFWRPYHDALAARILRDTPRMLVSLHSFTPQLASRPEEARPWQVGVLYNEDARAARIALPLLAGAGIVAGDNLPYSGKILNATMNRHGEANGIAYLGLEVRQDLIGNPAGVEAWCEQLAPVIAATRDALA